MKVSNPREIWSSPRSASKIPAGRGVGGNVYSVFTDNLRGPSVFDIWFSHSSDTAQTS